MLRGQQRDQGRARRPGGQLRAGGERGKPPERHAVFGRHPLARRSGVPLRVSAHAVACAHRPDAAGGRGAGRLRLSQGQEREFPLRPHHRRKQRDRHGERIRSGAHRGPDLQRQGRMLVQSGIQRQGGLPQGFRAAGAQRRGSGRPVQLHGPSRRAHRHPDPHRDPRRRGDRSLGHHQRQGEFPQNAGNHQRRKEQPHRRAQEGDPRVDLRIRHAERRKVVPRPGERQGRLPDGQVCGPDDAAGERGRASRPHHPHAHPDSAGHRHARAHPGARAHRDHHAPDPAARAQRHAHRRALSRLCPHPGL